ncbi:hypothetical protein, partial [Mycobacterium tuberculosis]
MDITIVGKYLSTLPEDDDHPYRCLLYTSDAA